MLWYHVHVRILTLSDLHGEFDYPDGFRRFVETLDPEGIDVVILAGDICTVLQFLEVMSMVCRRFPDAIVIKVHGNHEYYMSDRATVDERTQEALRQNRNLRYLDCSSTVVGGQRFVGATMWFRWAESNVRHEQFMNDFRLIRDFRSWVYDENLRATNYLEGTVNRDDIVITHHLPSPRSVAARFGSDGLNCFFLCDMEHMIRRHGPRVWVHGHTHDSFDYPIAHDGNTTDVTRVVCNPRGYAPGALNPSFDPGLVIEV